MEYKVWTLTPFLIQASYSCLGVHDSIKDRVAADRKFCCDKWNHDHGWINEPKKVKDSVELAKIFA